jgi:hypothetical protein
MLDLNAIQHVGVTVSNISKSLGKSYVRAARFTSIH